MKCDRASDWHLPLPSSLAETSLELRCDVEASPIKAIDIVTVDKNIFLEEPPEVLSLKGYDEDGSFNCVGDHVCSHPPHPFFAYRQHVFRPRRSGF